MHQLVEGRGVEPDNVSIAPEELRHDQARTALGQIVSRIVVLADVAIVERDPMIGEKLPHATTLLSGWSPRIGIQGVENDLRAHHDSH